MLEFKRGRLSARHNYWVNGTATIGFVVGKPDSLGTFYFLADPVGPEGREHRINAAVFDENGKMLAEIVRNRIGRNPGDCLYEPVEGGFKVTKPDGDLLLRARTIRFTNGFMTHMQGLLFDEHGNIRIDTGDSALRVIGDVQMDLESPFIFPSERSR